MHLILKKKSDYHIKKILKKFLSEGLPEETMDATMSMENETENEQIKQTFATDISTITSKETNDSFNYSGYEDESTLMDDYDYVRQTHLGMCDDGAVYYNSNNIMYAHQEFLTSVFTFGLNLYVSGQFFYVRDPYTLLCQSSFLRDQLTELEKIQSTTLHIDKDPELFQYILRYINTGYLFPLKHELLVRLKVESRLYDMPQLTDLIATQVACIQVNARGTITYLLRTSCIPFKFLMDIFECEPNYLTDESGRPFLDINCDEIHFLLDVVSTKFTDMHLPEFINTSTLKKSVDLMIKNIKEGFGSVVEQLKYIKKMVLVVESNENNTAKLSHET